MSLQAIPKILYHASPPETTKLSGKMGRNFPVEIGTRGTIGSLVMKEIEFFTNIKLESSGSSRKPVDHLASRNGNYWPSFGFLVMTPRRKKRRDTGIGILPSICSAVEVAESYWKLKADDE